VAKHKFISRQLRATLREARTAARDGYRETCGLLVDNGYFLELVPIRNRARRPGRFVLDGPRTRASVRATRQLGWRVVGTFHSHPWSTAEPGAGDIAGALRGSLMLVVDCIEGHAKLWRIGKNTARAVGFDAVES
jgi:proteasome lid subunit RPN8/RPN11